MEASFSSSSSSPDQVTSWAAVAASPPSDGNHHHHHRPTASYAGEGDVMMVTKTYKCSFCSRGFSNAQALGGHMNVHRRDRANKLLLLQTNNIIELPTNTTTTATTADQHLPPSPNNTPPEAQNNNTPVTPPNGSSCTIIHNNHIDAVPPSQQELELNKSSSSSAATSRHDQDTIISTLNLSHPWKIPTQEEQEDGITNYDIQLGGYQQLRPLFLQLPSSRLNTADKREQSYKLQVPKQQQNHGAHVVRGNNIVKQQYLDLELRLGPDPDSGSTTLASASATRQFF